MVGMLVVPALPIGGPDGEISQISRAEYWLILMASFESIWGQWTAGHAPTIGDRLYLGGCAAVWIGVAATLGWPIARRDGLLRIAGRAGAMGLSIAIGSALASLCVACNGSTFGPQSRIGLLVWFVGVGCSVYWLARHTATYKSGEDLQRCALRVPSDPAFEFSWARRWMGLTGVGTAWVLGLTLAGACLPSYDADVREYRNMAVRRFYLQDRVFGSGQPPDAAMPQGAIMPALFWMNPFVGLPPDPLDAMSVRGMVDAVLVGQMVQGMQWWVAIGLLMVSLARSYGVFASVLASFAIAACPGLFELVRLGGGAGEGGLYFVASVSLLMLGPTRAIPVASLACIAAGAAGQSWVIFLLVSVPIVLRIAIAPGLSLLRRTCLFIALGAVSLFWWVDALGPIVEMSLPWGRGGEGAWDACWRIAMNSTVHSLHLIPLAIIGLIFSRDRTARDAGVGFGVWCLVWWLLTSRHDRDWVIALPLLAWPMAGGIAWVRERGQGGALAAISGTALIWSTLVLCAWPTSDNRLLVPLAVLAPIVPSDERAGEGRGGNAQDLASMVNRTWTTLPPEQQKERWLLVGSADAFRWLPDSVVAGTRDRNPWERIIGSWKDENDDSVAAAKEAFARERLRFLVFDWAGLRHRDPAKGGGLSNVYRDRILQLQRSGVLRPVRWELSSGRAQCFEVIGMERPAHD